MKDLSNEELEHGINLLLDSDSFNNELARETLKHRFADLFSRLTAGEEAVKKVAELLKEVERLKATALAKHKEGL